MRITNKMINRNAVQSFNKSFADMARYQQEVSTGKKIQKLSDDPITAVRVLSVRSEIRNIDQYKANTEDSTLWLNMDESLLTKASGMVTSAKTEAQRATNATVDNATRGVIATEIAGIRTQLLDIANAKYQNRYLFGGSSTTTKPFASDGTYKGNTGQITRKIGPGGLTVQANFTGTEVFQSQVDVFSVLTDLQTALTNGDTAGINAQIDKLSKAQDQLLMARTETGSRINTVTMAATQLTDSKSLMTDYLSQQEDADYVESVMNLQTAQNVYQASLAAGVALQKTSLLDYIK